jgi:hypothetical protein
MDNLQKLTTLGAEDTRGSQKKKNTTQKTTNCGVFTHDMRRNLAKDTGHRTQYKDKQHTNHNSGK